MTLVHPITDCHYSNRWIFDRDHWVTEELEEGKVICKFCKVAYEVKEDNSEAC